MLKSNQLANCGQCIITLTKKESILQPEKDSTGPLSSCKMLYRYILQQFIEKEITYLIRVGCFNKDFLIVQGNYYENFV